MYEVSVIIPEKCWSQSQFSRAVTPVDVRPIGRSPVPPPYRTHSSWVFLSPAYDGSQLDVDPRHRSGEQRRRTHLADRARFVSRLQVQLNGLEPKYMELPERFCGAAVNPLWSDCTTSKKPDALWSRCFLGFFGR